MVNDKYDFEVACPLLEQKNYAELLMATSMEMVFAPFTCMDQVWSGYFTAVFPLLKNFRAPAGSYVVKRYGKPGAKQDRVPIGDD